jgi:hypothetical protein
VKKHKGNCGFSGKCYCVLEMAGFAAKKLTLNFDKPNFITFITNNKPKLI